MSLRLFDEIVRPPLKAGGNAIQRALAHLDLGCRLAIKYTLPRRDLGRSRAIKHPLARRDLGYGPIDRHIAIVLRRMMTDLFITAVWLPAGTIGGFAAALLAVGTAVAADWHLRLFHAFATAQVRVTVPAVLLPIVIAQVQAQLIIRLTIAIAPVGVTIPAVMFRPLGAEVPA
ncbi:MAG TPA: hypothetical protein VJX48_02645 [Xanthobacteraceae bacterium]|nr:hypothetical protein [Xanthobacteraceae bacterium]